MNASMALTSYHARYYALLLSRRAKTGGVESHLPALASANLGLHPHQIDAALFASRSVYRDGVILADEEGLGKTVEAGIALLQTVLDGGKNLLVLCPPALMDHWRSELADKFSLSARTLDDLVADDQVVLMSYGDAQRSAERLAAIPWDLCVLDEAHLLANAGLSDHIQSDTIRKALQGRPKLLLTATPIQNSVMDLYHLVRFVDDTTFIADPETFRARYIGHAKHRAELAERAQRICCRTLRRHALTMPTTRRTVRTLLVEPSTTETAFSKRMSAYFHRDPLLAFPKVQEHKIRLTFWKLLASSPRALAESLERVAARLDHVPGALDEQTELRALARQAEALTPGTRALAFRDALADTFAQFRVAGTPEKAVVFSESRATLAFLEEWLSLSGYTGRIAVHQSGTAGKKVLAAFASGKADILLATDAAGTGQDLSHCALLVNYDLPWNAQKLEQRISRCHRYGQQHDVMVLNFIDPTNRADRRLYDSLNQKMKRFDRLFGASETVLGHNAPAEVPAEMPRTAAEVMAEREATRTARQQDILREEKRAEADLLSHFDDEVRARFKHYGEAIPKALARMDGWLWELTKYKLSGHAAIDDVNRRFLLERSPYPGLRLSRITFAMDKTRPLAERYRLGHPLAKHLLADCLDGRLEHGVLTLKARGGFPPGLHGEIGLWLAGMASDVACETHPILCGVVHAGDVSRPLTAEQCAALMKLPVLACDGGPIPEEPGETHRGRHWRRPLDASVPQPSSTPCDPVLAAERDRATEAARTRFVAERDADLADELDRLKVWAEDEATALRIKQEEYGRRIKILKDKAAAATIMVERFQLKQQAATLERERQADEERIAALEPEIRRKRDALMATTRGRSTARFWEEEMFVAAFRVVSGAREAKAIRSGE